MAVIVLTALGLLPAPYGQWVDEVGGRVMLLIGPVTAPVYRFVRAITPEPGAPSEEVALLRNEIERWKALYHNAIHERDDWRQKFETLSRGSVFAEPPQAQILRPVIGGSSEPGRQIQVRAGGREGVEVNTVATTVGVQIVGRVVEVDPRLSWVRLITDRAAGPIGGVIMLDETTRGPICQLAPVRGGVLEGYVSGAAAQQPIAAGQIIRLSDERWPRSAQGLVVGVVTGVKKLATGHTVVTAEPTVDIERVAEVILRISPEDAGQSPGRMP